MTRRHISCSRALLASAILALACATVVPTASAQDLLAADEAERHRDHARTLFAEGVALVAERRFEEAEARFRQALSLHDAPSIRANLASVLLEQGEYPEAASLAESVAADASAPEASRASARLLVDQIRAQAGYVRIGGVDDGSGDVAIDTTVIPEPTSETPVAPGAHIATLTREGVERARAPFEVASGDHVTVTLDPVDVAALETPEESAPPPEPPVTETWWFWTAIGGGVVLVAIAVGIGVGVSSSAGTVVEPAVSGDFMPGVLRW